MFVIRKNSWIIQIYIPLFYCNKFDGIGFKLETNWRFKKNKDVFLFGFSILGFGLGYRYDKPVL